MGSLDLIRVDFDLIATAVPGSKIRTLAASARTQPRQVNATCHVRCHPLQLQLPSTSLYVLSVSPLRFGSPVWLREPTLNSPKGQRR